MIAFLLVGLLAFCLAAAALFAVWLLFAIAATRLCIGVIRTILGLFTGARR